MIRKTSLQFIKFCIVGIISTLLSYIAFYMALNFLQINYLISSALGFIFGFSLNYPANKYWTYAKKKDPQEKHIIPYISLYLFSLGLSLIMLRIMVETLAIIPEIANIVSIGFTTVVNFIGTRFFIFKEK